MLVQDVLQVGMPAYLVGEGVGGLITGNTDEGGVVVVVVRCYEICSITVIATLGPPTSSWSWLEPVRTVLSKIWWRPFQVSSVYWQFLV